MLPLLLPLEVDFLDYSGGHLSAECLFFMFDEYFICKYLFISGVTLPIEDILPVVGDTSEFLLMLSPFI